jgi:glycogen operon protein
LHGERIVGESFLLWLHADPDPVEVRLPGSDWAERYDVVLDTSVAEPEADGTAYAAGDPVTVLGRSCLLLQAAP